MVGIRKEEEEQEDTEKLEGGERERREIRKQQMMVMMMEKEGTRIKCAEERGTKGTKKSKIPNRRSGLILLVIKRKKGVRIGTRRRSESKNATEAKKMEEKMSMDKRDE